MVVGSEGKLISDIDEYEESIVDTEGELTLNYDVKTKTTWLSYGGESVRCNDLGEDNLFTIEVPDDCPFKVSQSGLATLIQGLKEDLTVDLTKYLTVENVNELIYKIDLLPEPYRVCTLINIISKLDADYDSNVSVKDGKYSSSEISEICKDIGSGKYTATTFLLNKILVEYPAYSKLVKQ